MASFLRSQHVLELPPRAQVELSQDAADLALDRVHRDVELRRHLQVAVAVRRKGGDPPLLMGEALHGADPRQTLADLAAMLEQLPVVGSGLVELAVDLGQVLLQARQPGLKGIQRRQPPGLTFQPAAGDTAELGLHEPNVASHAPIRHLRTAGQLDSNRGAGLNQLQTGGGSHRLGPVARVEVSQEAFHVALDGVVAQIQTSRDHRVRISLGHQPQHVLLAP